MNISIKIEYDNREQYLNTKKLSKFLLKHIKNRGKAEIYVSLEHYSPAAKRYYCEVKTTRVSGKPLID